MRKLIFSLLISLLCSFSWAQKTLQIAAYGGEIPNDLLKKFEQETGIKVNFTTFESNENLLLKLKSSKQKLYDLITPSNYYVNRLKNFDMLMPLDKEKIPNLHLINEDFLKKSQDIYGIPFVWGATGIFYNDKYIKTPPKHWNDLWNSRYKNQLLLLDDTREIFSMALMALGFSANDNVPAHINLAYQKLLHLTNNIKLFANEGITRTITDEDAVVGITWNGDLFKAQTENPHLHFIYPEEGYVVWAECFAITHNAQHIEEAYAFINFMLRPENMIEITKQFHFPITNLNAKKLLAPELANNSILFPDKNTFKRAVMQTDLSDNIIQLYNKYWELFKIAL
jgi:spermidine/putrescine transport system substrate-binding protein